MITANDLYLVMFLAGVFATLLVGYLVERIIIFFRNKKEERSYRSVIRFFNQAE